MDLVCIHLVLIGVAKLNNLELAFHYWIKVSEVSQFSRWIIVRIDKYFNCAIECISFLGGKRDNDIGDS